MNEKFPLALAEGTVLAGQYIIEKALGQGGFGITYKAKDYKTGQSVAVKEFFPEALATRSNTTVVPFTGERGESYEYGKGCFLQEAETLAQFIGIENIVRIHSYFEENGTAYFVMDYIEGISFDVYIKNKGGKISYEEAEKVLLKIIEALAVVHSKGIVHRDVTPDNIYITNDGVVKLLDFGAARYSVGDKSRSLDVVLKHGFAPKEQYTRHGKQGPFTDVYTVGASFYFAITGKRPPDSIDRIEEDDLVPPSRLGVQLPPEKENAILTAMSVQPADRYKTMDEFKAALLGQNTGKQQAAAAQPMPQAAQPMAQGGQMMNNGYAAPNQMPQMNQTAQMNQAAQMNPAMQMNRTQGQMMPQMAQNNMMPNQMAPNGYRQGQPNYATLGNVQQSKAAKKQWILPVCIGAAALLIIAIVGVVLLRNDDKGTTAPSNADYANNTSADNGGYDIPGNTMPDTSVPDTTVPDTSVPSTGSGTSTYDAGTFSDQVSLNNLTNGGWHATGGTDAWYYKPNIGLVHETAETAYELYSSENELIENIHSFDNGLIFTVNGTVAMNMNGETYQMEEFQGYDVDALWANDCGAFFVTGDSDSVSTLQYMDWDNGIRPYSVSINSSSCVTILGDMIYTVTADGTEIVGCNIDTALTEAAEWIMIAGTEGHEFKKLVAEGNYLYGASEYAGYHAVCRLPLSTGLLEWVTLSSPDFRISALSVYNGVIYYAAADWTNYATQIWNMEISAEGSIVRNDLLGETTSSTPMAVYDLCINPDYGVLWLMGSTPDYKRALAYLSMQGSEFWDYVVTN